MKPKKAFTVIELLFVICLIAVITAISFTIISHRNYHQYDGVTGARPALSR